MCGVTQQQFKNFSDEEQFQSAMRAMVDIMGTILGWIFLGII